MNDERLPPPAGQEWLPYGLLELPPQAVTEAGLETWLQDVLRPLALPVEFARKLSTAVRSAAAAVPAGAGQVRFLVFLPGGSAPAGQTWGFFQTVRSGESPEIACYLYAEGAAAG